jgi:hypothetical protein
MMIIDTFISLFFKKKERRKNRRGESLFSSAKVKNMVRITPEEARNHAAELLELLVSIHHQTKIADCPMDTKMLEEVGRMLTNLEMEERDIEAITLNLLKAYVKQLFNEILYFTEVNRDTYIDFDRTSEILERAKEVIGSSLSHEEDLRDIIESMTIELQRLRQSRRTLMKEGRSKFLKTLAGSYVVGITVVGLITSIGNVNISQVLGYSLFLAFVIYYLVEFFCKRVNVVSSSELLDDHDYFEE